MLVSVSCLGGKVTGPANTQKEKILLKSQYVIFFLIPIHGLPEFYTQTPPPLGVWLWAWLRLLGRGRGLGEVLSWDILGGGCAGAKGGKEVIRLNGEGGSLGWVPRGDPHGPSPPFLVWIPLIWRKLKLMCSQEALPVHPRVLLRVLCPPWGPWSCCGAASCSQVRWGRGCSGGRWG